MKFLHITTVYKDQKEKEVSLCNNNVIEHTTCRPMPWLLPKGIPFANPSSLQHCSAFPPLDG